MAYDLILQNIAKHISLSEEEKNYFTGLLKAETIKKKTFVLREGHLCNNIYYVSSGMLRAFHLDKEEKEATIMFALQDWWITDMACFIHQQPAMLFIEAVENSAVVALQKKDLDTLFVDVPKFEKFFRIIMQNAYIREQIRVIQNLSLSAEERYHSFILKYPQVAKQVTQKQIASYLGITPEFLSSLKKNKAK
jgi:CRP-like cAMP-binding protein